MEWADWVSRQLKKHHKEQREWESNNDFEYSVHDKMEKLLSSDLMKEHWRKIAKSLEAKSLYSEDEHVYSFIAGAFLMENRINSERLKMTKGEKSGFVGETIHSLEKLKSNLSLIGRKDLAGKIPEKEILAALDTAIRFRELGNPKNPNTDRDLLAFLCDSLFRSKLDKPLTDTVACIVGLTFDDPSYGRRSVEKAIPKIKKVLDLRPATPS